MQITTQLTHPLAIPTRRERESFEQNTSIKLKYFTLVPEATNVSSEELSVDSEDVENAGGIFFLCITLTDNSLRVKQIVGTFSDLADSLLLGKTETLNETNIKNYSQPR